MCGIYGYIGSTSKKKPLEECLDGLLKLQYRGYDSAGVASIHDGSVFSFRSVGKVDKLDALIKHNKLKLSTAIAHTRWATHGGLTTENTHPHIDYKNTLALVHNGIIENYLEIKSFLQEQGVTFVSETDTEAVTNLISFFCTTSIKDAIVKALSMIKGSFAIVLIHKDFPDAIFAGARNCPLAIGLCQKTRDVYISSDPTSFSSSTYNTYYLENDEIAKVTTNSLEIFDFEGKDKTKEYSKLIVKKSLSRKGDHEHFMHKEIHEQSLLCRKILKRRKDKQSYVISELAHDDDVLKTAEHIEIIACGSSYHAGLITKEFLERTSNIPVSVHLASEYRYAFHLEKKNTLALVISQSGETADTLAALRSKKDSFLLTIALCNVENSTLTRECNRFIPLYVGKEISVCSTKAFTGQLLNLYLLGIHLSNILDIPNKEFISEIHNIPFAVDDILNKEKSIKDYAIKYSKFPYFFFTGRGVMYPVSMEAALKLKEISYLPAESLPAGEMKHGPIALIDEKIATVAFLTNDETSSKTLSNLSEIKARDGKILLFTTEAHHDITSDAVVLKGLGNNTFTTIPLSIAGQIFSYHLAKELNCEIDFPRNLAKSVTVE